MNSYLLNDVAEVIDCEHKTVTTVDYKHAFGFAIGTPALRTDRINLKEAKPVDAATYLEWSKRTELREGDVIMAREAPAGGLGWVDGSLKFCLGQRTVCIRADNQNIDSKFLYYKLHDPAIQQLIEKMSSGSTVHHINVADIKKIELHNVPNITIQRKIASQLSEIDECIDLNLSIINNLEMLVRKAFEFWFLQFDFPNVNGKPYKSSGGEMKWSRELSKNIPVDWEITELSELVEVNSEAFLKSDLKSEFPVIDLSVMPEESFVLDSFSSSANFSTNLFHLKKYDLLFGSIRPYLKKAGFSPLNGLFAGTVHSMRPRRDDDFNFLLLTLTHDSLFKFAVAQSKGTKMPVVALNDLLSYKLAFKKEISREFNKHFELKAPIASKIEENRELRNLKNYLLPLAINSSIN
jgi:type I restriction enzyme S subunit